MIFNFTSAHVVEDFDFDWQKRILKFYFKTHTHTAEKNNQQAQTDFFVFYWKTISLQISLCGLIMIWEVITVTQFRLSNLLQIMNTIA